MIVPYKIDVGKKLKDFKILKVLPTLIPRATFHSVYKIMDIKIQKR